MRPVRIEVEGFSAYRKLVEVDFDGVDFFSITGPTGSGKSSLVDAMIFALYGRVPRLGGNAVAPVITAGTDRARVRFFFEVDDVVYDATRMAQRTSSGGASVKEARLQQGGTVIADGPGEVSDEVEQLLRLSFDDFTRTVVLPQGDFARFLEATKSERQGLLRNLLGLDVYTHVRELARTRAAVATEQAEAARRSLEDLAVPDEETRDSEVTRLANLQALVEELPEIESSIRELEQVLAGAKDEESRVVDALARLSAIEAPARLEELESLFSSARAKLVESELAKEKAAEHLQECESSLADLPTGEQLNSWTKVSKRLSEIDDRLEGDGIDAARANLSDTEAKLAEAVDKLELAQEATLQARTDHAAHLLAGALVVGEPCPVCAQEVVEANTPEDLPVLTDLEDAEARVNSEVTHLREATSDAKTALAALEVTRESLIEQRTELDGELTGVPEDLDSVIALHGKLTQELADGRTALERAEAEQKSAQKDIEDLADASRQISKSFTEAQLSVADLEPPVPEADDATVQWKELVTWRDETVGRLSDHKLALEKAVTDAKSNLEEARQAIGGRLRLLDIEAVEPYAGTVATAVERSRSTVEKHAATMERSTLLAEQAEDGEGRAAVANALANHLKANGFEQWLMSGALGDLVAGANELIGQLSDGGYSLHSDDSGSFSIVDHRNADEMRRVETLSGGETFLVSLALALSLAETLSAKGGAGLDAIVLDEGFGTLDDESLDTVASVLEELAGKGLMVGVITHVKELAARAPSRYEVTRDPTGAKVRLAS